MATVRSGDKTVLVIVDVQCGVVAEAVRAADTLERIAFCVEQARAQQVPVIWVQHADHNLVQGSAAWQWVPELVQVQLPSDIRVHKQFNSSFEQTPLDATLAELGATHLVLAGAATNWCIRATAYAALERGYDLTLVSDAHTTDTLVLEDGSRIEAETVIADLNAAMTWLRYPGRVNRAVKAAALEFSASRAAG